MPGSQQVLGSTHMHVGVGSAVGSAPIPIASPAVNLRPQLASVTLATNNPTLTTVALEKPLCVFDSSELLAGTYEVYLYVMVDSGKVLLPSTAPKGASPVSREEREQPLRLLATSQGQQLIQGHSFILSTNIY